MLKKLSILIFIMALLPTILFAQERMVMRPDGKFFKMKGGESTFEIMKVKPHKNVDGNEIKTLDKIPAGVNDLLDTLGYNDGSFNTNFGFFGQDRMIQWFEAPADMIIKKVAYNCTDDAGAFDIEMKLVDINLTKDELLAQPVHWDGYYEATGNGYNNITAYLDDPDRTGGWTSISGGPEPFGNDLWSDGGFGLLSTPVNDGNYQWLDLSILFEPTVTMGHIFGVSFKNTGPTMDADRIGFLSGVIGYPGWKFYANGRLDPGVDFGWWAREYTWDFLVEVLLTGDTPPEFVSITDLGTTIDTGPRTVDAVVTDANPSGGPAGVDYVDLYWSNDGGTTWNIVPMTGSEPNFSGDIPGQPAGTEVIYYLEAGDVEGNVSVSGNFDYLIFGPSGAPTLVIFNGFDDVNGFPQDSYWGPNIAGLATYFEHDEWAYGAIPDGLLDNYTNVIEICNGEPAAYTDDQVGPWLAADGSRNYYLAGQEWLGARYGYVDMDFVPGDFEYDVLGITHSYNDISYDGSSGQGIPTLVIPEAGTTFGQPLLDAFNATGADSLMYNPIFVIGEDNWQDAFDALGDVNIEMMVETRGIGGAPDVQVLPTMLSRELTAGNKIVFCAYDPISLSTAIDSSYLYYEWIGYLEDNSPYQALLWFGIDILTDIKNTGGSLPTEYSVSQNYPNPFNPSTTIKFSVPQSSKVTLKVYDVLGKEVATLVNEVKTAGNYEVDFNASNLASGMYIYTLNAGDFTVSKKMVLLK
ncbi:MAG: hypothetical protein Kow0098_11020 [Ignavibacteriaceae bacterium]